MKATTIALAALAALTVAACSGGGSGTLPQTALHNPPSTGAAGPPSSSDGITRSVTVGSGDVAAAATAKNFGYHIFKLHGGASPTRPMVNYPVDVTNQGGAVLPTSQQHAIFVNCPQGVATCWGAPMGFLSDLNSALAASATSFPHFVDQYVNNTGNNRYPVPNTNAAVTTTIFTDEYGVKVLNENDVLAVLHSGVKALIAAGKVPAQPGYAHEFHVFLPQGVDHCFDFGPCYSPDVPSEWAFCAYHGSTDFSDIGHIVFSVEPYQNVQGCASDPSITGAQIGVLADSTDNTLSHEVFESITDPDPTIAPAWYNEFTGYEIADLCVQWVFKFTQNTHQYQLQTEYANAQHGCVSTKNS